MNSTRRNSQARGFWIWRQSRSLWNSDLGDDRVPQVSLPAVGITFGCWAGDPHYWFAKKLGLEPGAVHDLPFVQAHPQWHWSPLACGKPWGRAQKGDSWESRQALHRALASRPSLLTGNPLGSEKLLHAWVPCSLTCFPYIWKEIFGRWRKDVWGNLYSIEDNEAVSFSYLLICLNSRKCFPHLSIFPVSNSSTQLPLIKS